jgi:hypothetical protein
MFEGFQAEIEKSASLRHFVKRYLGILSGSTGRRLKRTGAKRSKEIAELWNKNLGYLRTARDKSRFNNLLAAAKSSEKRINAAKALVKKITGRAAVGAGAGGLAGGGLLAAKLLAKKKGKTKDYVGEIEKNSSGLKRVLPILIGGAGAGALTLGSLMANKSVRKQIGKEVRDPRLYSNLRGMATLESRKKRVKAHKKLSKNKGGGILSAVRKGFTRS